MTRKAALMACGLALMPALVPVPALSDYVTPDGLGYTICHKPSSEEGSEGPTVRKRTVAYCTQY